MICLQACIIHRIKSFPGGTSYNSSPMSTLPQGNDKGSKSYVRDPTGLLTYILLLGSQSLRLPAITSILQRRNKIKELLAWLGLDPRLQTLSIITDSKLLSFLLQAPGEVRWEKGWLPWKGFSWRRLPLQGQSSTQPSPTGPVPCWDPGHQSLSQLREGHQHSHGTGPLWPLLQKWDPQGPCRAAGASGKASWKRKQLVSD